MDEKDYDYWRSEKVAFLALCQLKGIGYWTLHKWSAANVAFKDVLRDPRKYGIDKTVAGVSSDFDQAITTIWRQGIVVARQLASLNVTLLFKDEPDFPQRLRTISDAPSWLFVQGSIENLYGATVGIVGTRRPSHDGIFLTRMVVAALHGVKLATVSGLAVGIDQTAHLESLNCNIPTIAVLGTGILENYPKGSDQIRQKILDAGGTIVTEYLPTQSHSAENFVRRNRIQAALSDFLIPAEWKIKSGTAHTVRYAKAYGKRVVSVSLPYHEKSTPEILFIKHECNGLTFVLPYQSDTLSDIVATLSETDTPTHEHAASFHLSSSPEKANETISTGDVNAPDGNVGEAVSECETELSYELSLSEPEPEPEPEQEPADEHEVSDEEIKQPHSGQLPLI